MVDQVVSYAQNGEDVVLWRALGQIAGGTYLDIGANDPTTDSISRLFYDNGWSGVTVEPVPAFVEKHREQRPRDITVQAAITDGDPGEMVLNVIDESGLSTLDDEVARHHAEEGRPSHPVVVPTTRLDRLVSEHLAGREVHFCCIDVEGLEKAVLDSVDLTVFRPWVLVIEATAPNSAEPRHQQWEPQVLAAGYEFCLFDGLSRFYVATEHADDLRDTLSYPACPHDDFVPLYTANMQAHAEHMANEWHAANARIGVQDAQLAQLRADLNYWRGQVIESWARLSAPAPPPPPAPEPVIVQDEAAVRELQAIRQTLSWKVTTPLRLVRRLLPGRS